MSQAKYQEKITQVQAFHPKIDESTAKKLLEFVDQAVEAAYEQAVIDCNVGRCFHNREPWLQGLIEREGVIQQPQAATIASLYAKEHGFKP